MCSLHSVVAEGKAFSHLLFEILASNLSAILLQNIKQDPITNMVTSN